MLGRGLICWSASGANELRFRSTRFLPALLGGLLLGAFALAAPEALVPSEARAATPETQYDAVPMLAPDLQTGARFGRVKRIYFFLSHIIPPGTTPPGINPPGIHPPGIHPPGVLPPTTRRPPVLPRANLPGLRLSARRLVRGRRTIFIVRGLLRLPPSIAGSQRSRVCHGSVTVAARRGHKTGASKTVGLRKDCSFSLRILVSTRKLGRKGRYNIRARFHGNANINARSQTTNIH